VKTTRFCARFSAYNFCTSDGGQSSLPLPLATPPSTCLMADRALYEVTWRLYGTSAGRRLVSITFLSSTVRTRH